MHNSITQASTNELILEINQFYFVSWAKKSHKPSVMPLSSAENTTWKGNCLSQWYEACWSTFWGTTDPACFQSALEKKKGILATERFQWLQNTILTNNTCLEGKKKHTHTKTHNKVNKHLPKKKMFVFLITVLAFFLRGLQLTTSCLMCPAHPFYCHSIFYASGNTADWEQLSISDTLHWMPSAFGIGIVKCNEKFLPVIVSKSHSTVKRSSLMR